MPRIPTCVVLTLLAAPCAYDVTAFTGGSCNTANASKACTDAYGYCDTATGTCACKKNFVGTNANACASVSCASIACTEPNSACDGSDECVCDHLSTADTTTGACTRHTCTTDNVTTACGTQAACEWNPNALQCVCNVNFATSHTGDTCIQKTCAGTSTDNCDPNSACVSDICQCASTHTASGSRCKRDCSSGSNVCDSNASCVNNVCECGINFQGGGGTSDCKQLTCTGADATTCHPNSHCVNGKCQRTCLEDYEPSTTCVACRTGWKSDGAVCKKTCKSNEDCGPTTAVCISERCECATNFVGNGTSCASKKCAANTDCGTASNYTCTSGSCACASGYTYSTAVRDCISSAGTAMSSFALMIAATFMLIFTGKIF